MKATKTWILIANEKVARIVENDGPGKGVFQPSGMARQASYSGSLKDDPGRSFQSKGKSRSKFEGHQNGKVSPNGFAGELVRDLRRSHTKGCFDRLIICAAPKTLNQLKQLLPATLRGVVSAEIPKDLTHTPTGELATHFENVLAV